MNAVIRTLLVAASLLVSVQANAAFVKRVTSLQGQFSDSFESGELTNVLGGIATVSGGAGTTLAVQNGNMFNLWDQHAFDGDYFLGANAGYGGMATVAINFRVPVTGFGGVFGHRVRPGVESAGDTLFVFYDAKGREIGRDSVFIGSEPGGVPAYWEFTRAVSKVTMSYIHPIADALTARTSTVSYRKLERAAALSSGSLVAKR